MSQSNPQEKRRSKRRPILQTFSLFAVVPRKGDHRLHVHDLSDQGIGFDLDIDGESPADFPVQSQEKLELQLYLNQSLSLSLEVEVKRIEDAGGVRRVGAEFIRINSPSYKAYASFLQMLDLLGEAAQIHSS